MNNNSLHFDSHSPPHISDITNFKRGRRISRSEEPSLGSIPENIPDVLGHQRAADDVLSDNLSSTSPRGLSTSLDDLSLFGDLTLLGSDGYIDPDDKENCNVREKLDSVEKKLERVTCERDELKIKFNAINEQLNRIPDGLQLGGDIQSLAQLNTDLRRRLERDHNEYRRKLFAYMDGQDRQRIIIRRLQTKLLKVKKHMDELERENQELKKRLALSQSETQEHSVRVERHYDYQFSRQSDISRTEHTMEQEIIQVRLDEEQRKNENLTRLNSVLREQLDEAGRANNDLQIEIDRLTSNWAADSEIWQRREKELQIQEDHVDESLAAEQQRLVKMWRFIIQFRQQHYTMKSGLEKEITQLQQEINRIMRLTKAACLNLEANQKNQFNQLELQHQRNKGDVSEMEEQYKDRIHEMEQLNIETERKMRELQHRIKELERENVQLEKENNDKEQLMINLHRIRGGEKLDCENMDAMTRQILEDTEALHQALRDIAQAVIDDADNNYFTSGRFDSSEELAVLGGRFPRSLNSTTSVPSLHASRSHSPSMMKSSTIHRSIRFPALADSTFTAVQSALNKRSLQVQDLRCKLMSGKEHLDDIKQQLDDSEQERRQLERQLLSFREQLDSTIRERDDLQRDKERLKNALDTVVGDKSQLEKSRSSMQEQLDAMEQEVINAKNSNAELQKQRDGLEDDKADLKSDVDRHLREIERLRRTLESVEDKNSQLKNELVVLKESISHLHLEKEVLEQNHGEVNDALNRSETRAAELEVCISKLKSDEANLKDALYRMAAINETLEREKNDLKRLLVKFNEEKNQIVGEKHALELEKDGIKEELIRIEREKLELDTEKLGLFHSVEVAQMTRERLEEEVSILQKEKLEFQNKLTIQQRTYVSLEEDLRHSLRDVERHSQSVLRLSKEKDEVVREKNVYHTQVPPLEKEIRRLKELLTNAIRAKEDTENAVYETNKNLEKCESRQLQLETENKELHSQIDLLLSDSQRIRKEFDIECQKLNRTREQTQNRLKEVEKELDETIKRYRNEKEEELRRVHQDKSAVGNERCTHHETTIAKLTAEKEELLENFKKEKNALANEIMSMQRERDDAILAAENDKQYALNAAEQDKFTLQERFNQLQYTVRSLEMDLERLRQEAQQKQAHDKEIITSGQQELKRFRVQFEEKCASHEGEVKRLNQHIQEICTEREAMQKEVAHLTCSLRLAEESRDTYRRDLLESNARLKQYSEQIDALRKEISDIRRTLAEERLEKDTLNNSNSEYRGKVKELCTESGELKRLLNELKQRLEVTTHQRDDFHKQNDENRLNLREVERARLEARHELEELRRNVKQLDTERGMLVKAVSDLQGRVERDEDKDESTRREYYGLKQRVVETEASREALRKEIQTIQRTLIQTEEALRNKEKELLLTVEEVNGEYRHLDEKKRQLEIQLEHSQLEVGDLKSKLGNTEGRLAVMETQLARALGARKDAEFKLAAIHGILRRLTGYRQEKSRSSTPRGLIRRQRSPSPLGSRRTIHRGRSPGSFVGVDFLKRKSPSRSPLRNMSSGTLTKTLRYHSPTSLNSRAYPLGSVENELNMLNDEEIGDPHVATNPLSDIDPESVRLHLRDFVQHFMTMERDHEVALARVNSTEQRLKQSEQYLEEMENRLRQFQSSVGDAEEDRKDIDGRLSSAKTALMLQEESIRRGERERKAMMDKLSDLETQLSKVRYENQKLTEKLQNSRQGDHRTEEEKKALQRALNEAENHCTQLEIYKRAAEGDMHRMKLALNDKALEIEVLQDRNDNLNKQIQDLESKSQSLQLTIDRLMVSLAKTEEEESVQKDKVQQLHMNLTDQGGLIHSLQDRISQLQKALTSSEQDRRVLEERFYTTKTTLNDAKEKTNQVLARLEAMQQEMSEMELRKGESEAENRQLNLLLVKRQEAEQELQKRLQKLTNEKGQLNETITKLQNTIDSLESEKNDLEKSQKLLETSHMTIKRNLERIRNEKQDSDCIARSQQDYIAMETALRRMQEENNDLQREIQKLQEQFSEVEQTHAQRIVDMTTRHRSETQSEISRLRTAQAQVERALETKDKVYRQRLRSMEDQITSLKEQLSQELKKRHLYLHTSSRVGSEEAALRHLLDSSLSQVTRDPGPNATLLELERKRLEEQINEVTRDKSVSTGRLNLSLGSGRDSSPMLENGRSRTPIPISPSVISARNSLSRKTLTSPNAGYSSSLKK